MAPAAVRKEETEMSSRLKDVGGDKDGDGWQGNRE